MIGDCVSFGEFELIDILSYKAKKKINCMSQRCRARLFFDARLIQQNPSFYFLLLAYFFSQFFYELACQNIHVKI